MVDLAKIRKKAKKQGAGGRAQGESTSLPVDESTSGDPSTTRRLDDSTTPPSPTPASSAKLERFKAEAGQRRENRIEQVVDAKERLELLTFVIAGEQYAIDIEKI